MSGLWLAKMEDEEEEEEEEEASERERCDQTSRLRCGDVRALTLWLRATRRAVNKHSAACDHPGRPLTGWRVNRPGAYLCSSAGQSSCERRSGHVGWARARITLASQPACWAKQDWSQALLFVQLNKQAASERE